MPAVENALPHDAHFFLAAGIVLGGAVAAGAGFLSGALYAGTVVVVGGAIDFGAASDALKALAWGDGFEMSFEVAGGAEGVDWESDAGGDSEGGAENDGGGGGGRLAGLGGVVVLAARWWSLQRHGQSSPQRSSGLVGHARSRASTQRPQSHAHLMLSCWPGKVMHEHSAALRPENVSTMTEAARSRSLRKRSQSGPEVAGMPHPFRAGTSSAGRTVDGSPCHDESVSPVRNPAADWTRSSNRSRTACESSGRSTTTGTMSGSVLA